MERVKKSGVRYFRKKKIGEYFNRVIGRKSLGPGQGLHYGEIFVTFGYMEIHRKSFTVQKIRVIAKNHPHFMKVTAFSTLYSLSFLSSSQPSAQKVKEADVLYDQNKFKEILHVLHPFKEEKNDEVLWRLGRALYKLSQEISDPKQKKEMIFEAYNYVSEALSINEKNSAVHKWMSIMIDAKSKYQGLKEKITQAYVMKKHMLRAVELNPKDATVLHLLGTWCFEVANMAWYERKVASTIFAAPPNSSFEEALSFFVKAEETDPCFYSMNLLMLGKTYLKLNNKDKAKHYLELVQGYPQKTAEDAQAHIMFIKEICN
ncbi:regulator of microtubule dynamics protein 1-like isoform X2 [Ischnura elegans]|uniref:regulator of microtubule dynamics protein 1-like isoform X2 n=1 Tax=Ischnura elegans TaxID=197161 RepID=UPI001ED8B8E4|nr:regulator of microtubule dynamics protein 1-like isoform X2 [Ischnura elegans]